MENAKIVWNALLAAFTLIVSLGSFSFVIFFIASSILWLFGEPLSILEYIEYISCVVLESQYINNGLKSPHNVAEIIAKYNKTTIEKYYKDLEKRMSGNSKSGSNFLNIFSPLARLNISILSFIIKNYQLIIGVIFLGTIYSLYKIVLYFRHSKTFQKYTKKW